MNYKAYEQDKASSNLTFKIEVIVVPNTVVKIK